MRWVPRWRHFPRQARRPISAPRSRCHRETPQAPCFPFRIEYQHFAVVACLHHWSGRSKWKRITRLWPPGGRWLFPICPRMPCSRRWSVSWLL